MSSGIVAAVGTFNFGDYTGLTFYGGTFYPCWADNSNSTGDNPGGTLGTFDIYTARVTVHSPLLMFCGPERLPNPAGPTYRSLP